MNKHAIYKNAAGKRLCGVTTIMGVLSKPYLIPWANRLGLEGIDSTAYVDETARIGTLAHYMAQCVLSGTKPDLHEYSPLEIDHAENSMFSFYEWLKHNKVDPVELELPLISEKYQYGGTIDCYATLNGNLWLIDLKTSKRIYDEHLIQLGAYMQLLNENGYECKQARILRIGREESDAFEERVITNVDKYFEMFMHCHALFYLKKELNF